MLGVSAALAAPMLQLGRCRLGASTLTVSTRAVDVVLGTTVVDMLGLLTFDWDRLAHWQAEPSSFTETDYRRLEATGIGICHPAVDTNASDPHAAALRWTAGWNRLLVDRGCFLERIATAEDLLAVGARGRIGVVVGFQNSDHFRSAADVELFHRLGQRVSQLTYNRRNRLGSGCYSAWDLGLTELGAAVVGEMNRVGMAIDVSHCGERTSLDAIALSRRPILITHANCAALVPGQPRCKSDAVIRAAAAGGGVLGVTMVRAFVGRGQPGLDDLVAHVEHVARLVGVEHVGIGSDVDADAVDPATGRVRPAYSIRGLEPGARVFQLADALLARGWLARDVESVLGGNFLRALAANWPAPALVGDGRAESRDPFCPAPHPAGPAAAGAS
jgi:membrane dipeptidase